MSSVYFFLCPWEGFPRQTCNNHLRRKQGCELMDQIQTVVWQLLRQPWEELVPWERTLWHWSKHVKFSPSRLFHTGCLSLHSCQTAILPHVGTLNSAYWAFSTFQSAFISAIALIVPWNFNRKTLMSSVYFFLCPWEGFPRQTCSNHLRRKYRCELMDQIQTVRGAKFTKNKNDQRSSAARVSVSKCINPWYMTHSVLPFTIREPRQVCLNCAGLWLCAVWGFRTVHIPLAGRHWYFRV